MADILIIDDDDAFRTVLRLALESVGHRVREAPNGSQGIRSHQEQPTALILCDLFMPDKEGLETIRELRSNDGVVKIIAMSGGASGMAMDFLPLAEKFGAVKTLYKPFEMQALLDAVREAGVEEDINGHEAPLHPHG